MAGSWLGPLLDWIAAHPHGAGLAVFCVAASEGLLLVGLLVPGVVIMFGVGAIVASGAMWLPSTLAWAAAGALCGDGISYLFGRRYRGRLRDLRLFSRYPSLLERGNAFFVRHGGKSIVLGRFIGPMRPIVPAVAGAAGMVPSRFLLFDTAASLLWSPAYILPGVVFGASLGLAAQVASRLAVVVLLVVGIVWSVLWLTRTAFAALQPAGEALLLRLLDWSQRHRRLGHLGASLADPGQPETPALAVLAVGLLTVAWLAFVLIWGVSSPPHPQRIDALVYQLLRGLHTAWTNPAAVALMQLGTWSVCAPVALMVFVHLLWARRYRAAAHWAAAVAFAAVLATGLQVLVSVPPPSRFYHVLNGGLGGHHAILSTVVYGFLPVLLTTGRRRKGRWPYYGAAGSLILLIALAQLYMGAQWLSITALGLGAGLAWVGVLGLAYRRHNSRAVPRAALAATALAVLAAAGTWRCMSALPAYHHLRAEHVATRWISATQWRAGAFRDLPAYRIDLSGSPELPLNLQWAGTLTQVRATLSALGWQPPQRPSLTHVLLWLGAGTPVARLPVLPQFNDGQREALVMIKPIDPRHERIVRLWPSRWRLNRPQAEPIWVGMAASARVHSVLSILFLPTTVSGFSGSQQALARHLCALGLVPVLHRRSNGQVLLVGPAGPDQRRSTPHGASNCWDSPK